ncbi:uncharacterized protein LOC114515780 [Dendronephthya gigantea]|uniref:uncharacterized protein LOC114515780 n=1 Tax=Dendronephthya gigantea TaxID=151771 RepID=UPI00106D9BD7|nr:uncharacterized protein LOC114515780 [Dendronephthya gigantea]
MKSNDEMDRIPPLPNDIEAIIFDCDGTLVDTMPFHLQAWAQICDETGLFYSKESFIAKAGIPGREIIRTMAKSQGIYLDVMNVYNRKKALYLQGIRRATPASLPVSCVVNFAVEAKSINDSILFGVATGSSRYQVEEVLGLAGLRHLFDVVVGNEDYSLHKPNPDAFLTACEKLNVDPTKCWGFEDTEIGLESIRSAGFNKAIDVRLLSGYPA